MAKKKRKLAKPVKPPTSLTTKTPSIKRDITDILDTEDHIVVTTLPEPTVKDELKQLKKNAKAWLASKPKLNYPEEVRLSGWLSEGEKLFK